MVVVADATGQPHAVVIKSIAAAFTQLAVLGSVGNHNLEWGEERLIALALAAYSTVYSMRHQLGRGRRHLEAKLKSNRLQMLRLK